jgi:hypothetical protein
MTNFPNPEFPISSKDCADIEAIYIELMRAHDAAAADPTSLVPPANSQDLRAEWGLQ